MPRDKPEIEVIFDLGFYSELKVTITEKTTGRSVTTIINHFPVLDINHHSNKGNKSISDLSEAIVVMIIPVIPGKKP